MFRVRAVHSVLGGSPLGRWLELLEQETVAGVKCVRVMVVCLCECDRVIVMGCVIVMYVVMSWRRFWLCVIMMTCVALSV